VPRLLDLLEEFEIAATWATVGFLFARSRDELDEVAPTLRPVYADRRLCPYGEKIGANEEEDPLHFAASLIERIRNTPKQEIATHTFSHFYVREKGQNRAAFRADLEAAVEIARRRGIALKSIVFPRNQRNPDYDADLMDLGIAAFRGNPTSYAWKFTDHRRGRAYSRRALRLAQSYLPLSRPSTTNWSKIIEPSGLANVRASLPLRPYDPRVSAFDALRRRKIVAHLDRAVRRREVFHLWWHPHNFGAHTLENLSFLRGILEEVDRRRQRGMLESLTMAAAADMAREAQ
jgi:peptidoglycan/xylan/chitin deacetylase (PgdA/CDA1 family)